MLNAVFSTYLATDFVRFMDTLVDTLIERKARMQVKSLKNTLKKKKKQVLLNTQAAWLSEV